MQVKTSLFLTTLIISPLVTANTLANLTVVDGIAFFETVSEPDTYPVCVSQGNEKSWAISLDSSTGAAVYSMLLTSLAANNSAIEITGTGNCDAMEGVQTASMVRFIPAETIDNSGEADFIGIYTGDDELIGKVVDVVDETTFLYVAAEGTEQLETFEMPTYGKPQIFYSERDCVGDVRSYVGGTINSHPTYNDGRFFSVGTTMVGLDYLSIGRVDGSCVNSRGYVGNAREISSNAEDETCGNYPCYVK